MSKSGLWAIAAVAVFTLLGLVYLAISWEAPQGTTTVVLPTPAAEPEAPQDPEPNAPGAEPGSNLPRIRIQPETPPPAVADTEVEVAPAPTEVEPEPEPEPDAGPALQLPSLSNSDSFVLNQIRALQNGAALVELLSDEQLVRSFVVLVDNVSRNSFPQTALPYRGMSEEMPVRNLDDNLFVMEQAAHGRFDDIIDTFVAVDTGAAMALYRALSPLFQRAYAELGYGDASFDTALSRAINNVLQMDIPEGPYQLVKPSVMYLYADADLENLPAVHKQLIRLGPENTARLKNKLRQFADRLQ
jgi:hypothetical protein